MLGYLGDVQKLNEKAKFFSENLIEGTEEVSQYKEANDYFWQIFQEKPLLRTRCWKKWKMFIVKSLDHIPKALSVLYLVEKEAGSFVFKLDNKYLIEDIWSFFRQVETNWEEREDFLYEYKELLKEEELYMWSCFTEEERNAVIHFKKLEKIDSSEQWEIDLELQKITCFIMDYHPAKQTKIALVVLLRNHGIVDLSFLAKST